MIETEQTLTSEPPEILDATADAGAPADESTGGPVRDEQGRFAHKDPEVSEDGELATADSALAEAAEPPPEAAPVVAAAPAPVAGKPFTYRADGQTHQIEGVEEMEDGSIRVTPEASYAIRQLVSRGHHHNNGFTQRLQQERAQSEQAVTSARRDATTYEQVAMKFLGVLQDPERLLRLAHDPNEVKLLQMEALMEVQRAGVNTQPAVHTSATPQYESAQEWIQAGQQNQEIAVTKANDYAELLLEQDPAFKMIRSEADRKEVFQELALNFDDLFTIYKGQPVLDQVRVQRIMAAAVRRISAVQAVSSKVAQTKTAADQAKEANAQRDKKPQVPPAPSGRAPAAAPKDVPREKTYAERKAEWEAENGF